MKQHILRRKALNIIDNGFINKSVLGYIKNDNPNRSSKEQLNEDLVNIYYITYNNKKYTILEQDFITDKNKIETEYYEVDNEFLQEVRIVSEKEVFDDTMNGLKDTLTDLVEALKEIN